MSANAPLTQRIAAILDDAPHADYCGAPSSSGSQVFECRCWKAEALSELEAAAELERARGADWERRLHEIWGYAKDNPGKHADGYDKKAFAYVLAWSRWYVTASPPAQDSHTQTDQCGFDRNSSHTEGRYVCMCGWREPVEPKLCWLIENKEAPRQGQYLERYSYGACYWTDDPEKAMRFHSKQFAQEYINGRTLKVFEVVVCEHMFNCRSSEPLDADLAITEAMHILGANEGEHLVALAHRVAARLRAMNAQPPAQDSAAQECKHDNSAWNAFMTSGTCKDCGAKLRMEDHKMVAGPSSAAGVEPSAVKELRYNEDLSDAGKQQVISYIDSLTARLREMEEYGRHAYDQGFRDGISAGQRDREALRKALQEMVTYSDDYCDNHIRIGELGSTLTGMARAALSASPGARE